VLFRSGNAIVFSFILLILGFVLTGFYPENGIITIGIAIGGIFFSTAGYQYTVKLIRSGHGRNKSETKIFKDQSKKKLKEMEKEAQVMTSGKQPKQGKKRDIRCCLITIAIAALMVIFTIASLGPS
jgi:hypothetical protein